MLQVYHSFHDEVNSYRQHWWRCDGPCRDRKPFYGWVKRAMNRAPSPRDTWWPQHQATCGGTYQKVHEPDGYGQKKKGAKKGKSDAAGTSAPASAASQTKPDIRSYMGTTAPMIVSDGRLMRKPNPDDKSAAPDVITPSQKFGSKSGGQDTAGGRLPLGDRQQNSARVLDHIGKGLSKNDKIEPVSGLLASGPSGPSIAGTGVGRDGNIHSVGKFLKGESTRGQSRDTRAPVAAFVGAGNVLGGGSGSGAQRSGSGSGCAGSRLLNMFPHSGAVAGRAGPVLNTNRGQKRPVDHTAATNCDKKRKSDKTMDAFIVTNKRFSAESNSSPKPPKEDASGRTVLSSSGENSRTNGTSSNHSSTDDFSSSQRSPAPIREQQNSTDKVPCPVCNKTVDFDSINDHLNACLS